MKRLILSLLLILIITIISTAQEAQAYGSYHSSYSSGDNGWLAGLDGMYYWTTENQNSPSTTTDTRQVINPYLGYHFNLIYLGATYDYDAFIHSVSGQATLTNSFRSWGASVGLMTDSVYLTFTYYFSTIGTLNGGGTPAQVIDLSNGSGYQAELGYMFDIGSGFKLGPDLTYKSITYSTSGNNSGSYTWSFFLPHINLRYNF